VEEGKILGWQSHISREKAMIRLLLVDDHPIVLEGLRSIFESSDDCQVIGELTGSVDLHTRILVRAAELDLVLLDARMPDFDPIATVRALAATHPPLKILILSSYDSPEYVHGLINAGAQGYILKDEPREIILSAVRIVAAGDMYISPRVARVYVQRQRRYNEARDRLIELTDREREVLRLVGAGYDNEQIGNELTISYDTVKNHLRNIYAKLGVTNRYQAIVFAFRSGLISLE
jgi:DNA-binding NarL/FixJ family response regulator